ncbi:MAG: RNA polymerase sigma factor, partial [Acidimicrobiales bacterium]
ARLGIVEMPGPWRPAAADGAAPPVAAERALEDTYRRLAPAVLGYFRARGVAEPEDLVGEVFLGVARGWHRFRGDDDAMRRWVFTIAYRRLVDDRRRSAVRSRQAVSTPALLAAHDRPAGLDIDLVRALEELTPLQRDVVLLRFVADLPLHEVARILRRRVGAIKALQSRGLNQLGHRLSPG